MSRKEQECRQMSPRVVDIPTLLLLLAALIFLYVFLFLPPFVPIAVGEDSPQYLADAKRMFEGQVMYRDFFAFVTPGLALLNLLLFKLVGLRLWIPNLELLLLGPGLAWIGIIIAKKLMHPSLALLPSAIFLAGMYSRQLDATHHWFSLLTASAAIAVLMERRTPARIATAGFFCGLTACFTQTRGLAVAVAFAAYLWWESRQRHEDRRRLFKQEAWLGAGFFATLLAVNGYFIWKAGLARFLWCTVVFLFKYAPKYGEANSILAFRPSLPAFGSLHNLILRSIEFVSLYVLIPFTYILFFARYWRDRSKRPTGFWERPMLLAMVGFALLLSTAPAPGPLRMAASELPGVILLVWFIDSPRKVTRALAGLLAAGTVLIALNAVVRERPVPRWILTTPQGRLVVGDQETYEMYTWIQQHTRPSEYFFEAGGVDIYFFLDLRDPTPLPFLRNNGFTTPEQVTEVIQGLEQHHVRYILWYPDLDLVTDAKDASEYNLWPLRNQIYSHYQRVKVFANSGALWESTRP